MRRVSLFLLDYVVSEDKRKARKRPTPARVPDRPPVCAVGTLPSPLAIHESMSTGKYVAHILGNKRAQRLPNALFAVSATHVATPACGSSLSGARDPRPSRFSRHPSRLLAHPHGRLRRSIQHLPHVNLPRAMHIESKNESGAYACAGNGRSGRTVSISLSSCPT